MHRMCLHLWCFQLKKSILRLHGVSSIVNKKLAKVTPILSTSQLTCPCPGYAGDVRKTFGNINLSILWPVPKWKQRSACLCGIWRLYFHQRWENAQRSCFHKITADVSSGQLGRFGEKDSFFKKWRSCRHCLQSLLVSALRTNSTAGTKKSTNQKGHKPKTAWTKKSMNQKEHKPNRARTKKSTD